MKMKDVTDDLLKNRNAHALLIFSKFGYQMKKWPIYGKKWTLRKEITKSTSKIILQKIPWDKKSLRKVLNFLKMNFESSSHYQIIFNFPTYSKEEIDIKLKCYITS